MNDADGFRLEAADQFGFEEIGQDEFGRPGYQETEAQLIAFAKACERKGLAEAAQLLRQRASQFGYRTTTCDDLILAARELEKQIAAFDAELAPLLEAERQRCLALKTPFELMAGDLAKHLTSQLCDDEGCPQHGTDHVCVERVQS